MKKIEEKVDNKILTENLKYIFKFKIFHYYEELNKQIEKDEEKVKVEINNYLGDQSFIYFKNAYHSLVGFFGWEIFADVQSLVNVKGRTFSPSLIVTT